MATLVVWAPSDAGFESPSMVLITPCATGVPAQVDEDGRAPANSQLGIHSNCRTTNEQKKLEFTTAAQKARTDREVAKSFGRQLLSSGLFDSRQQVVVANLAQKITAQQQGLGVGFLPV